MILIILAGICISIATFAALLIAPPTVGLGNMSKLLFFHVPVAWVSVLAFIYAGIRSIIDLNKLQKGKTVDQYKAYNSAKIGIVFTILAIISGSIWAKINWNSYWNWDPRQKTIIFILLIYVAYISLYKSIKNKNKQFRISSVYLIIAMVSVPLFVFILPRMSHSLHPDIIGKKQNYIAIDYKIRLILYGSAFSYSLMFIVILRLLDKASKVKKMLEEIYEN